MGERFLVVSIAQTPQMSGAGLPSCDSRQRWLSVSQGNQAQELSGENL